MAPEQSQHWKAGSVHCRIETFRFRHGFPGFVLKQCLPGHQARWFTGGGRKITSGRWVPPQGVPPDGPPAGVLQNPQGLFANPWGHHGRPIVLMAPIPRYVKAGVVKIRIMCHTLKQTMICMRRNCTVQSPISGPPWSRYRQVKFSGFSTFTNNSSRTITPLGIWTQATAFPETNRFLKKVQKTCRFSSSPTSLRLLSPNWDYLSDFEEGHLSFYGIKSTHTGLALWIDLWLRKINRYFLQYRQLGPCPRRSLMVVSSKMDRAESGINW